jgi:hypothetical protein
LRAGESARYRAIEEHNNAPCAPKSSQSAPDWQSYTILLRRLLDKACGYRHSNNNNNEVSPMELED